MLVGNYSVGQKGREILEIDVSEVLRDLNSAYADEWLAHYQYFLYALVIEGIDAEELKEKLEEQSKDEMNHAKELVNRILELGGKPTTKLTEASTCGFSEPPEDYSDLVRVIELVLEGERCAIEKYNNLAKKYHMKDLVTHEIFEDLLKDEVSDEEEWENFLPALKQKQVEQRYKEQSSSSSLPTSTTAEAATAAATQPATQA
jgi:bacterioferritin